MKMQQSLCGAISLLVALTVGCTPVEEKGASKTNSGTIVASVSAAPSTNSTQTVAPSSAPIGSSVPASPTVAASDPLATLFRGAPDPAVKFLGTKTLKGEPIAVQYPPGWTTNRDDPSIDYVDSELHLYGKENHAQAWLAMIPKTTELKAAAISFNAKRVTASGATFEAPIEGHLGAGDYTAKIARGKATVAKHEREVWYAIVDVGPQKTLVVFASLRKEVYPKLEAELVAILRSVKRVGG